MTIRHRIWAGFALLALAGCGGGDGGGDPPAPPKPPLRSGEVDVTYGTGRVAFTVSEEIPSEMAVAPDGSVYVTGRSIRKVDATGQVVPTYGEGGRVAIPARSPVVDADGYLYVISERIDWIAERWVVKLDPTGRIDPSFGIGGRAELPSPATHRTFDKLARDAQGNLYVAGLTEDAPLGPFQSSSKLAVTKLSPDGRIDPSFGTAGSSMTPIAGFVIGAMALAADSELNIAVGGRLVITAWGAPARARMVKIDRSGVPISEFGAAGVWEGFEGCASGELLAIASAPSGALAVGGSCFSAVPGLAQATVHKIDRHGQRVNSYQDGGFTLFGPTTPGGFVVESQAVWALHPYPGGHYAAGHRRGATCTQGAVSKLDTNGQRVADFGFGGFVAFDEINSVRSLGTDAAGRLYLGGYRLSACSAVDAFVVLRLGG